MKVGTDAILLGSLVTVDQPQRILDIGTGTGVVALMLAQRTEASGSVIHAVEIDSEAAKQATENAAASPWSNRITIETASLQEFAAQSAGAEFDLVISNPPFYFGRQSNRQQSRHADWLPPKILLDNVAGLLTREGRFAMVVPRLYDRIVSRALGKSGLSLARRVDIQSLPEKPANRHVLELTRESVVDPITQTLVIEHWHHNYTEEFYRLTSEFYLDQTFRRMTPPNQPRSGESF